MMGGNLNLTEKGAWIFRITHIDNVQWILAHGLHCKNSSVCDPNYVDIGNPDLIALREERTVESGAGGTLSDYIPFYFTPHSPMLLNIKTGFHGLKQQPMQDIVVLVTSLHRLQKSGIRFLITDRHAYLKACNFSDDLADLSMIDWKILRERDFKRSNSDPGKMERYQAEALVHEHCPVSALDSIICYGEPQATKVRRLCDRAGVTVKVGARPDLYF
jgi:hypothetical protein